MEGITTFSEYLKSVLDSYENNYGYYPKNIYLDYQWLQKIKSDSYFYNEDYLNFIGFNDQKETQILAYLGDINIQIIKDGIDRWYNKNLNKLFDLEPFIYISDFVMTERDCFYQIKHRKQVFKYHLPSHD